jgi:hypothetical protein
VCDGNIVIYTLSYLIIYSHPCLGLPCVLFPLDFLTKILYALLILAMCATYSAHIILFHLIILIVFGEEYIFEAPHYTGFSSLLSLHPSCVKIFSTRNLFYNIFNLCSSRSVTDQVSHLYKTGKNIVLYRPVLIVMILIADKKAEDSELHGSKHSRI